MALRQRDRLHRVVPPGSPRWRCVDAVRGPDRHQQFAAGARQGHARDGRTPSEGHRRPPARAGVPGALREPELAMSPAGTLPVHLRTHRMPPPVSPATLPAHRPRKAVNRPALVHLPVAGRRAVSYSRSPVLDETLFTGALIRERKRADRSNQPFAVLLLALGDDRGRADASLQTAAIEALLAVKGETD